MRYSDEALHVAKDKLPPLVSGRSLSKKRKKSEQQRLVLAAVRVLDRRARAPGPSIYCILQMLINKRPIRVYHHHNDQYNSPNCVNEL